MLVPVSVGACFPVNSDRTAHRDVESREARHTMIRQVSKRICRAHNVGESPAESEAQEVGKA